MTDTTILPALKGAATIAYRTDKLAGQEGVPSDRAELPSAKSRLDDSRSRVRSELMAIAHPPSRPSSGVGLRVTAMVKDVPGVGLAVDTAQRWWHEHRATAQTAGQASQAILEPIARKHPAGTMLVSAGIGAGLVFFRPWRLLLRPKILLGAASVIAMQAFRTRSPGAWLRVAVKLAESKRPRI